MFPDPLTIHLKSVGLIKFLVAVGMTGIVAHVGRGHFGDVQRAIIPKVLAEGEKWKRNKTLNDFKKVLVVLLLECRCNGCMYIKPAMTSFNGNATSLQSADEKININEKYQYQ